MAASVISTTLFSSWSFLFPTMIKVASWRENCLASLSQDWTCWKESKLYKASIIKYNFKDMSIHQNKLPCNIISYDDTKWSTEIASSDWLVALLTSCVPYLYFDNFAIDFHKLHAELHSHSMLGTRIDYTIIMIRINSKLENI